MNKFYSYIILVVAATSTLLASCSSDELQATITLSQEAVYFTTINQSTTISYTGSNISTLVADSDDIPDGWAININRTDKTILVVGPTTYDDFKSSLSSTVITFTATSVDDDEGYDYLTVGTTELSQNISDEQANSFIVSSPNTVYTFSAEVIGENQGTITPESVKILWQTSPKPLSYSMLTTEGDVEFHVKIDEDDDDDDDLTDDLLEGNAVIAAYDEDDNILWSWHIWISDYDADSSAITVNNTTLMSRNLGANDNSIYDESSILESYGLYYQWGRKDPFVGAYYYNAADATDAAMRTESGATTYISYLDSNKSRGTQEYARENPLTFILGVEESSYDWLYSTHTSTLWSDSEKSVNDPCPKGWRVATPETFEGLMIPALSETEIEAASSKYGWDLTDSSGNSSLFMGLGRRGYITGKIQNVNLNAERPTPWAGFYWTSRPDEETNDSATAMYFSLDDAAFAGNEIMLSTFYRSNGMQVRCQRDE